MPNKIIIANWKMNPISQKRAKLLFDAIEKGIKDIKNAQIVICPPFIYLKDVVNNLHRSERCKLKIEIGCQDCFYEEKGAFTGEISPKMLKDLGIRYVILGHSERRRYCKETDEMINKKIKIALKLELNPILCIGETLEQRKQGKTFEVLKEQLKRDLKGIENYLPVSSCRARRADKLKIKNLIIAYEPIWAISTNSNQRDCSVQDAIESISFIRKIISQKFNKKIAEIISIIYGGNVHSKNAKGFLRHSEIDGVLVGSASLKSKEFIKMVKFANEVN